MDDSVFDWVMPLRKKVKQNHEVVIYGIEKVKKILSAALNDDDRDMLIWFTVAFFSGIRVDEMTRLTWAHFNWEERAISLSKTDVAKGGDPRHIKFNSAFEAWIVKVPDVETLTGPIVNSVNWRHRLDRFHGRAGVSKKRNALRHTFASYHYVKLGDADATRKILGQKTADVLFANYVHLVRGKQAEAFWQLTPKKIEESCNLFLDDTKK